MQTMTETIFQYWMQHWDRGGKDLRVGRSR